MHRSSHWFALRRVASLWWNVDSSSHVPRSSSRRTSPSLASSGRWPHLHVCRSEAPLPLPQLLSGEGHEAVFHPLDYLLQYPPLDPNAPISYTPGALDLDDAATAAAFAEAESIAGPRPLPNDCKRKNGAEGRGRPPTDLRRRHGRHRGASTIGAAIGAASTEVSSPLRAIGSAARMGSHGESQLDADAALAAALMAADMEELGRRTAAATPTQASSGGGCASSRASALAVGTQRVVGQLSNELAGLRSAVVRGGVPKPHHARRAWKKATAWQWQQQGRSGRYGRWSRRRRKGRSSRRSSSSRMWSTIRSSRLTQAAHDGGAHTVPRGIPRCASDGRSDCRVAAGVGPRYSSGGGGRDWRGRGGCCCCCW